jgi:hypothetical protein|tara:strand:+ start:278 stop:556 length:279 start_codon:yes stop_codon:yes gene_type:complete
MVELTQREQTIVHVMNLMMNPLTKSVPIDTRAIALKTMLGMRGIDASVEFCQDISHAVTSEMEQAQQGGFKLLDDNKELLKNVDFSQLAKKG